MAKQSLEDLTRDPLVLALAQADDKQLVNELIAAGFLSVSLTTLRGWRTTGRKPPASIKVATSVRYPVGELRKFVEQALGGDIVEPALAAIALPRPAPPAPSTRAPRGMDLKPVTKGRRKGVRHASFAQFLVEADPTDKWVFALIPDATGGDHRRPVDLIETLRMREEIIADATVEQLTLKAYLDRLQLYFHVREAQADASRRQSGTKPFEGKEKRDRPKKRS